MKQAKPQRPRNPRIECSVPECKRGTTTFEPGTQMICGRCWRKAPKEIRRWYSYWRRKANTLEKREDPRADECHDRASAKWHQVLRLLTAPPEDSAAVPPLMAEQLRKDGLL